MVIQQKISTRKLVTVGACMHKTYSYLCKLFLKTFQKEAQIWANPQIPRDFDSVRNLLVAIDSIFQFKLKLPE